MENKDHTTIKKYKSSDSHESPSPLIPGLPGHLAQLCLSPLPPALLYSVSHSWRRVIYSPTFPPFYSLYALLIPKSSGLTNNIQQQEECNSSLGFFSFNPFSSKWESLPSPPTSPRLGLLHRHPSFISRILPIQSLTVSNKLLLVAGSTQNFLPALQCPLVFDPLSKSWFLGPKFLTPRRWCITGSAGGSAYIISGMGSEYRSDVAQSVEKWDMKKEEKGWRWEKMGASMKDGRFSREANESVGYRGKLCMVNVKGKGVKDGAVYKISSNEWEEMPAGMLSGWKGPAAVDENQEMYVIDQAKGALSRYDSENDFWKELIRSPEHLKGAEQVAAGRGRVCAVCSGSGGGTQRIAVVDVVAKPTRVNIVYPPEGMEVVAVHILPRMNHSDDHF